MIDKNRFISITDAIIAVAATVMVLRLDIPQEPSIEAISSQWPTFLAYIVSYLHIFMAWHEHHDSFANAVNINHRIFLMNCVWLFFVTVLPFATGLVGQSPTDRFAVLIYVLILFLCQFTLKIECDYSNRYNGTEMADDDIIRAIRKESFICDVIAAAAAFAFPLLGLIIVLISSVLDVILVVRYDIKHYS